MTMTRDELAQLARRDARVFIAGSAAALLAFVVLILIKAGVLSTRHAASVIVVISAIVVPGCLSWWLIGPRELRSQRYLVLAPLGLISGPLIYSLSALGAAGFALVLSVSFGFGAAIAGGLALNARRRSG
jgi:hypothetical protein